MENIKIRILKKDINDVRGKLLKKGFCFIVKTQAPLVHTRINETCLILLDNGADYLEDFKQHVVQKDLLYKNSI